MIKQTLTDVINYLLKICVFDLIDLFPKIYSIMAQDTKINDDAAEMLDEFEKEYMKNGFELISKSTRFVIVFAIIGVILFIIQATRFIQLSYIFIR